jgi:hypothetical protein
MEERLHPEEFTLKGVRLLIIFGIFEFTILMLYTWA